MGMAKAKMMSDEERGWSSLDDRFVCTACVDDDALKRLIKSASESSRCDYCGQSSSAKHPIAAPVDIVLEAVFEGLRSEYGDPTEELPYDSGEGGFQGEVVDIYDLLRDHEVTSNEELFDEVVGAGHQEYWCQRDYFSLRPDQEIAASWENFCEIVKHQTRYLFTLPENDGPDPPDERRIPPSMMLDALGGWMRAAGLVATVRASAGLFRARVHPPDRVYSTAVQLGPPPVESARFSNRMSPAGIPMFYAADDPDTALAETYDPNRTEPVVGTIATFQLSRDVKVLDLAKLPIVPSLFDASRRGQRPFARFLKGFVDSLSEPIEKDGREHIHYVPTQIVTEYVRRCFQDESDAPVAGIRYSSSRHAGGVCYVLFVGQNDCAELGHSSSGAADTVNPMLLLDPGSITRISLPAPELSGSPSARAELVRES